MARHYGDIQDKRGEIRMLERLFDLEPSLPTARTACSRTIGSRASSTREETLLRRLLGINLITANDAETARPAAGVERRPLWRARRARAVRRDRQSGAHVGRFALFDVLVQIGDRSTALSKGASWTVYWRKASLHHPTDSGLPVAA